MSRRLGGVAAMVLFVLALAVSLGAGSAPGTRHEASTDKVILFSSDGMRPDLMEEYARHGSMPTYRVPDSRGRSRSQRPDAGLSAEHRRRLGHPGDRRVARGTRLDEQHVPSADRPELQQLDELRRAGGAPGRHARAGRRAGRQGRRLCRVGGGARVRAGAPGPGRGLPVVLLAARDPAQLRHPGPARPRECVRRRLPPGHARPGNRLDERADVVQPGQGGAADGHDDLRGREPDEVLRPLHLRLDERQHRQLRPRARRPGADEERRAGRRQPDPEPVGRRQGDARRGAGRPDRGHLAEGHRPGARPVAVPALLHLGHQGERDVQRARPAGLGRVRGNARPRLPDLGCCRLRATRGRHRRRGHVRRAGPQVGGRASRVPPLHLRNAGRRGGSAPHGNSDHRRVRTPVHGALHAAGHRQRPEPVLRRRGGRRRQRQPRRDPRGLRPLGVRRGRRDARSRPRADGRGGHDRLRVLRPRHGSSVVRGQRRQGAARRRPADRGAERQLPLVPELSAEPAAGAEGQGLLRGRDGAVLHQPRRPPPGGHRAGRRVRERAQPDHPGVPGPDRPGEPGEAGRVGDPAQGAALERRRLRLAQPDPKWRRRRRDAAAVPVRRGDAGAADRVLAVLRAARVSPEPRQDLAQREHARDVPCRRAGYPRRWRRRERRRRPGRPRRARDRRRSYDRLPHGHRRPCAGDRRGARRRDRASLREESLWPGPARGGPRAG